MRLQRASRWRSIPSAAIAALAALTSIPGASEGQGFAARVAITVHSDIAVTGVLRAVDEGDSGLPDHVIQVEAPWSGEVALRPEGKWKIAFSSPGYWSSQLLVGEEGEGEEFELHVIPTGVVRGNLSHDGDLSTVAVEAEFQVESRKVRLTGKVPCDIQGRSLSCILPSGALDLKVQVPGFASHYLWGVQVGPERELDVGTVKLVPGSSIVGWVTNASGNEGELPTVRLWARHLAAPTSADSVHQAALRSATVSAFEDGFFQFSGLLQGEYIVRAAEGELASVDVPVVVDSREELTIEAPIELYESRPLDVYLDPELDPRDREWVVVIDGTTLEGKPWSMLRRASPAGFVQFEPVDFGPLHIEVLDGDEARWHSESLVHSPWSGSTVTSIDVLEIQGHLRIGEQRLPGKIWFGGRNGRRNIPLDADESGEFNGFLPGPGLWAIEVSFPEQDGVRTADAVDIDRSSDGRPTRVDIALPDTLVSGRVEEKGLPREASVIGVRVDDQGGYAKQFQVWTEPDGVFEIRGIEPVETTLLAFADGVSSTEYSVDVAEGQEHTGLVLELGTVLRLSGRVHGRHGAGIPGALIFAYPDARKPDSVVAGGDGTFELRLPDSAQTVTLIVVASGYGTRLLRFPVATPENQTAINLELSPDYGSARLSFPENLPSGDVVYEGVRFPMALFLSSLGRAQALSLGDHVDGAPSVELERLTAGLWAFCSPNASERPQCQSKSILRGGVTEWEFHED